MGFCIWETVWIGMSDGTRLAATIWMPEGDGPFPAVLEFLPYRRRDGTTARDESTYPYYAHAGIAGVRVDSRGQGDSEGLFDDEYSPQELADCCEVIAWIAAQDWSNGGVGMMGISWGGFNGLQVAAMRPPALKGVISIASTADRYTDDIHYKGGALLGANISWAGTMLSYASRPPDPDVVGNRWAAIWRERLEAEPMLLEVWLRHQHRDAYWKHGSICEDWEAIACPVWVIAGWADGYRNCPATLAKHLPGTVKAMTGPWVHKYPHFAKPAPRADFHTMSIDWWRQCLAGEARGVGDWPDHAAYRVENARPLLWRSAEQGTWIDAPKAPARSALRLGPQGLLGGDAACTAVIATPQHCGTTAGEYFTLKPDAEMPGDQRSDDGLSVCWQTPVQDSPMDIVGRPRLTARVAIDQLQGNLIARLCDIAPDGTSTLIARGVLNLCHRHSHARPQAMAPGHAEDIALAMDETCYRVLPGHRLRVALSTAYWPLIQPSPTPVTATLEDASLDVPVAPEALEITVNPPPRDDFLPDYPQHEPGHSRRHVEHDLTAGRVRYTISEDTGLIENPHNAMQSHETRNEVWEIDPADPEGASGRLVFTALRQREGWSTRTEARIHFTCHHDHYAVEASVTAWHDEAEFLSRSWSFSVPRDLV